MNEKAAKVRAVRLAICASSVAIVVGSVGPWKMLFDITTSGLGRDGSAGDGVFTLILGALAGIATVLRLWRPDRRRWLDWAALVLLGLVSLIGIYDWLDVRRIGSDTGDLVRIGWGLHLTAAASSLALVLAIVTIVFEFGRRAEAGATVEDAVAQDDPTDPTWVTAQTGAEGA